MSVRGIICFVFFLVIGLFGCTRQEPQRGEPNIRQKKVDSQPKIELVDAYKVWNFEDGLRPLLRFKVKNLSDHKLSSIPFNAVWIKNGVEQFCTAEKVVYDIEPGLISEEVVMHPPNGFDDGKAVSHAMAILEGKEVNLVAEMEDSVRQFNENLSLKLYFTLDGTQQVLYNGPFNGSVKSTPLF